MARPLPPHIQSPLRDLCADNVRGSTELASALIALLSIVGESGESLPADDVKSLVRRVTEDALQSHRAMATIFNVSNNLLFLIERMSNRDEILAAILSYCTKVREGMASARESIAENGATIIRDGMTVAVHSRSSAVEDLLRRAHTQGTKFNVLCFESRPMMEGTLLAAALAEEGIEVALAVDAAMFSLVSRMNLVLVGADGITSDGIVNKIGTHALALAARHSEIDSYACFSMDKVFPKNYRPAIERRRDPREVTDPLISGVEIVNEYFEVTPLSYFTGFITDLGILDEPSLRKNIDSREIHPSLDWTLSRFPRC